MQDFDYAFGCEGISSIEETREKTGEGRTKTYFRIDKKELRAAKMGRKTVVCNRSIREFLASLPEYKGGASHG